MTPVESEIVMDMLGTCENPPEYEVEIREAMEVRVGCLIPRRSLGGRSTGRARRPQQPGSSGCRGAKAEDGVSRRRWSLVQGMETEMGQSVNGK